MTSVLSLEVYDYKVYHMINEIYRRTNIIIQSSGI